jgi:RNA polymerase sigma-54 factor
MTKMQLTARLDQRLAMSQQLRQAIALLQYNTVDLKQIVQHHLENNPMLELEELESHSIENPVPAMTAANNQDKSSAQDYTAGLRHSQRHADYSDDNSLENYAVPPSLREHLLEQTLLCHFDEIEQAVAVAIIDALDDCGHLTMTLAEIRSTLSVPATISVALMTKILNKIQAMDPIGVGSHDVRECLLLQLEMISDKSPTWLIAKNILLYCFDNMATYNIKKILKQLGISATDYTAAIALLRELHPHPGLLYTNEREVTIEPELYVKKIKNKWQVFLADSVLTNVKINQQYQRLLKKSKKHQSYEALNKELQEAQWLLKGLQRRNDTLLKVASYLVELQKDFLDQGHMYMKPMNIIDVADALSLHESTISRVTTGKYIAMPRGVFELKFFFPSHLKTQSGVDCSDTAVKAYIRDIIDNESLTHPLSDSDIALLLQEKGIQIARRTVAKYREAMKILSSYQRAQLQPARDNEVETV